MKTVMVVTGMFLASLLPASLSRAAVPDAPVTPDAPDAPDDGSSFTLRPDYDHKEIYDVYAKLQQQGQNQFITVDVALHSGHLLFDYSLRAIEIDKLSTQAEKLTKAMAAQAARDLALIAAKRMVSPEYGNDLEAILAYFCVPAKILDPNFEIPIVVKERVEKDLAALEKHEGFAISAALDNAEDFSQYVPRGHYTRNEELKRYFKAMMWYGRRMFRVEETGPTSLPVPDHWSEAYLLAETRQMLLVTQMLYEVQIDGKPAIETWNALYVPTVLFAGRTEDLNPMEVKALAEKVWGRWPTPNELTRAREKILEFAKQAAAFSHPKVDSSGAGRKGFCFMAQRFTPDSYITQCLVTEGLRPFGDGVPRHVLAYTGKKDPKPFTWGINRYMTPPEHRFMPRGLDVMAVLGCNEALAILKADGDTDYEGYDAMLAFLRQDVGRMMDERRGENLYYAWLYALQPMLQPIDSPHVPSCLRSQGWMRKQLATSLASWAELRHDTILYVKQSYTPSARAPMPGSRETPVFFVEPQPEVFRRMARMVTKMRQDLGALGVLPEGLEQNYERFAATCGRLADVADSELAGRNLSLEDQQFLAGAVMDLKSCTVLPAALRAKVLSETDSSMALTADVHTDTNATVVLEECVGTPCLLTVTMKMDERTVTLSGAAFSYYEFKQPMADRLTDEAWQKKLASDKDRPVLPTWFSASKE